MNSSATPLPSRALRRVFAQREVGAPPIRKRGYAGGLYKGHDSPQFDRIGGAVLRRPLDGMRIWMSPMTEGRAKRVARAMNAALERCLSLRLIRTGHAHPSRTGMEPSALAALKAVAGRTMADELQQYATFSAGRYVVAAGIPGAVVECGVWRGGCSMLMILGLLDAGDVSRDVWLYDTFEGMTDPQERDAFLADGIAAEAMLNRSPKSGATNDEWTVWCVADEADVTSGLHETGYPMERVRLIRGPVEQTLAANLPDRIAIARLDTDWYSSTKTELELLYDRISPGGVLILDDYDDWAGARDAVDEFFADRGQSPFLIRAGFGRVHIKNT